MKNLVYFFIVLLVAIISFTACNNNSSTVKIKITVIKEENIAYSSDSASLNGFMAYDSAITGKRPVVLIVHEWWGLNDYSKSRARQLAALGYLAFAIDMYGDGKMGNNPDEAGKLAAPFYQDMTLAKRRFDAALTKIKTFEQADATKMAAIGYCFGGGIVLNMARLGEKLNGVVSFHGSLVGATPDKNLLTAKILVCHGADDQFVKPEEVTLFKKQMDSIGAAYTFISYPGATHAFSNPAATKMGEKFNIPIAYNEAADLGSWKETQDFFNKIFK